MKISTIYTTIDHTQFNDVIERFIRQCFRVQKNNPKRMSCFISGKNALRITALIANQNYNEGY